MLIRTQQGYREYERKWPWTRQQRQANVRVTKLARAAVRFGGYGGHSKIDSLVKRAQRRRACEQRRKERHA